MRETISETIVHVNAKTHPVIQSLRPRSSLRRWGAFFAREQLRKEFAFRRKDRGFGAALENLLGRENVKHGRENLRTLSDLLERTSDNGGPHGSGVSEFPCVRSPEPDSLFFMPSISTARREVCTAFSR